MPPIPTHHEHAMQLAALSVLESREQLVWYANARNDSISQTTLHFEKKLYGLEHMHARPVYTEAVYGEKLPEHLSLEKKKRKVAEKGSSKGKGRDGNDGASAGGQAWFGVSAHQNIAEREREDAARNGAGTRLSVALFRRDRQQQHGEEEEVGDAAADTQAKRDRKARDDRSSAGSVTEKKRIRHSSGII